MAPEPQVIFTADDFGYSSAVNRAVIRAHRDGVLTSASLMVAGDAAAEAVRFAQETPTLSVGLHLVVADGRAVLPPRQIDSLVDPAGRFPRSPVQTGLRYAFNARARRQLALEIRAQFQRFGDFGLKLSHVDCHMQMHMHPVVFHILRPLLQEFAVPGIRIPRDELRISLSHNRKSLVARVGRTVTMRLLSRYCVARLNGFPIRYTERVYGIAQSGVMDEAYVADVLQHLGWGSAELILHPAVGARIEQLGPNPGDLEVLLSPSIRNLIHRRRLRLTSYPFLD